MKKVKGVKVYKEIYEMRYEIYMYESRFNRYIRNGLYFNIPNK